MRRLHSALGRDLGRLDFLVPLACLALGVLGGALAWQLHEQGSHESGRLALLSSLGSAARAKAAKALSIEQAGLRRRGRYGRGFEPLVMSDPPAWVSATVAPGRRRITVKATVGASSPSGAKAMTASFTAAAMAGGPPKLTCDVIGGDAADAAALGCRFPSSQLGGLYDPLKPPGRWTLPR